MRYLPRFPDPYPHTYCIFRQNHLSTLLQLDDKAKPRKLEPLAPLNTLKVPTATAGTKT